MDAINTLSLKIKQAADEIVRLRADNAALSSEVELLRAQLKQAAYTRQENARLHAVEDKMKTRLERISKKISHLLAAEPALSNGINGGSHEQFAE